MGTLVLSQNRFLRFLLAFCAVFFSISRMAESQPVARSGPLIAELENSTLCGPDLIISISTGNKNSTVFQTRDVEQLIGAIRLASSMECGSEPNSIRLTESNGMEFKYNASARKTANWALVESQSDAPRPKAMPVLRYRGGQDKRCAALTAWAKDANSEAEIAWLFKSQNFKAVFGQTFLSLKDRKLRKITIDLSRCAIHQDLIWTAFGPLNYRSMETNGAQERYAKFDRLRRAAEASADAPLGPFRLDRAGYLIQSTPRFDIHFLASRWEDGVRPQCPDTDIANISIIHKVDDDFQIDASYLRAAFADKDFAAPLRANCPGVAGVNAEHYYFQRPMAYNQDPLTLEQAVSSQLQHPVLKTTYRFGAPNSFSADGILKRIGSYAYTDILRYNANGRRTDQQIAAQNEREAEIKRLTIENAERVRIGREARATWFANEKKLSNWPLGDNQLFDVYVRTGTKSGAPPNGRTLSDNMGRRDMLAAMAGQESFTPYNNHFLVVAYVEQASRLCGADTPNGATTFALSASRDGYVVNEDTVTVDRKLAARYERSKRHLGITYRPLILRDVQELQGHMRPLYDSWHCSGPEWKKYIDGLNNPNG